MQSQWLGAKLFPVYATPARDDKESKLHHTGHEKSRHTLGPLRVALSNMVLLRKPPVMLS
jgi:hypothetical protein